MEQRCAVNLKQDSYKEDRIYVAVKLIKIKYKKKVFKPPQKRHI